MSEFPEFTHNRQDKKPKMPLAGNPMSATADPTPPFGTRPSTAFQEFHTASNLVIQNLFFNQFTVGADLLGFYGCNNIYISDCDFQMPTDASPANRKSIYLQGCTGTLTITRCRFKYLAFCAIQFNTSQMVGIISDNRLRGTTPNTEDCISMFRSGGVDSANRLLIYNNRIDGNDPVTGTPGYTSSSGTGLNIGDSANASTYGYIDAVDNTFLNCGQAGMAMAGGTDQRFDGNQVYSIQTGTSNVGMSIWMNGGSTICTQIEARQNRVKWTNSLGADNGLFQNGNCGTIANLSDNNFSDSTLDPLKMAVRLL